MAPESVPYLLHALIRIKEAGCARFLQRIRHLSGGRSSDPSGTEERDCPIADRNVDHVGHIVGHVHRYIAMDSACFHR